MGDLENATDLQKKKMENMQTKLDELLKYTNDKVKDLGLQMQTESTKSDDVMIKFQEIKRTWLALVNVQNESETTKTLLQTGKQELPFIFEKTVIFLDKNGHERPDNLKDGTTDFPEMCFNQKILMETLTNSISDQIKVITDSEEKEEKLEALLNQEKEKNCQASNKNTQLLETVRKTFEMEKGQLQEKLDRKVEEFNRLTEESNKLRSVQGSNPNHDQVCKNCSSLQKE